MTTPNSTSSKDVIKIRASEAFPGTTTPLRSLRQEGGGGGNAGCTTLQLVNIKLSRSSWLNRPGRLLGLGHVPRPAAKRIDENPSTFFFFFLASYINLSENICLFFPRRALNPFVPLKKVIKIKILQTPMDTDRIYCNFLSYNCGRINHALNFLFQTQNNLKHSQHTIVKCKCAAIWRGYDD